MRFVIYGAGAIGGVVGARLHQAGHQVELIARGAHLEAVASGGLVLESPEGTERLSIRAVGDPTELDWDEPAVVLLAVKGQDTDGALEHLAGVAPASTPIVCAQNGVENERRVLRRFEHTYGMCVVCAATHLRAGVVQVHFTPVSGLMDLGRYPSGVDPTSEAVAEVLSGASFDSVARPDIMRWKYRKLVHNLVNAVEALCGAAGRGSQVAREAQAEGEAVLAAAGIDVASVEEDRARRGKLLFGDGRALSATASGEWSGGSSWQSVVRGTSSVEVDYLNGEIVVLGRIHGIPTPVNTLLQARAHQMVRVGAQPGAVTPDELLAAARR
ncbi:MAG: 2-dehydropantoate 2-reductase [Actinomycetota bacterium]|nr:2-dehydropantoate 2-reductase [Actinomycetota bacterium]